MKKKKKKILFFTVINPHISCIRKERSVFIFSFMKSWPWVKADGLVRKDLHVLLSTKKYKYTETYT